jgi:hypothetical protein
MQINWKRKGPKMNKGTAWLAPTIATVAIGLAWGTPALADDTSKEVKSQAKGMYKQSVKQAEADYKSAEAKCDSLTGNDKDVCVKEAKATYQKAKADAKAARKSQSARAEAGEDKREASYKVAKEKCAALSGDEKSACVAQAKAKYNQ